jgi:hypothetical protein
LANNLHDFAARSTRVNADQCLFTNAQIDFGLNVGECEAAATGEQLGWLNKNSQINSLKLQGFI